MRTPVGLELAARTPPAPSASAQAVDFLVPGLEHLHFVAYGASDGSVAVVGAQVRGALPPQPNQRAVEVVVVVVLLAEQQQQQQAAERAGHA